MAGATLCVSCASLPFKDRAAAITLKNCPECKTTVGVTSYGAAFRLAPAKRGFVSTALITGMTIGAGLFVFVIGAIAFGLWSKEQVSRPNPSAVAPETNDHLMRVTEVAVSERFDPKVQPSVAKSNISNLIERIRQTNNGNNKDAFVLANMERRPELRGLPFVMGNDCRLQRNRAQSFQASVEAVREGMEADSHAQQTENTPLWSAYLATGGNQGFDTDHGVAALTQILGPERKAIRRELIAKLKTSNSPDATKAIARAAVFDADPEIRYAAVKALKADHKQESAEVTDILMHGIRYPLAVVATRSAQAIVRLERKDLLMAMVDVLGEPAPGDPAESTVNGEKAHTIREVVKINHHRNCLLCHPPSQTGGTEEVPGVIPIPGSAFPTSPREAYGRAQSSGEPMVRADTTYLRQDFSVMMPVENAAPWPDKQRFDFLVRTRVVEGKELATLQQKVQARPADQLSTNQKAALNVLTDLSGHANVAPNQAAWQRVLGGERAH